MNLQFTFHIDFDKSLNEVQVKEETFDALRLELNLLFSFSLNKKKIVKSKKKKLFDIFSLAVAVDEHVFFFYFSLEFKIISIMIQR